MKRLLAGVVIGLFIGFIGTSIYLICLLPGAPSQYGPRFPMSSEPLPTNAISQVKPTIVGFDIYTNPKAPPSIRKNEILPVLKKKTWSTSVQQDGFIHVRRTIWVECNARLYEVGHFDKRVLGGETMFPAMTTELSINQMRRITERVTIPDVGFDVTIGPFVLP